MNGRDFPTLGLILQMLNVIQIKCHINFYVENSQVNVKRFGFFKGFQLAENLLDEIFKLMQAPSII